MRKTFYILSALLLILSSCADDKGYFISGTVKGLEDGKKVYVSELDGKTRSPVIIDTGVVKNGEFEIDLKERDLPVLSFLRFEGVNGNMIFISENEKINFDIHKDSIRTSHVSGGKENKALFEYLDHLNALNKKMGNLQREMRSKMSNGDPEELQKLREAQMELQENDKNFKIELFNRNKDTYLAVMLLSDMLNMKTQSSSEVREMYAKISDRIKKTDLAKDLERNLETMRAAEVGSKAPGFTGPNPEGKEISLNDNLGKVTVVDFWAAWCKPCRIENPNLVRTYNKYKDQGLNIISVSLDRPGQKERWVEAIEADKLEQWDHVSNLQFWQDPIAKKYGVNAIPATFILDENGVIVAKNLRGEALAEKIGELLK
jgi:peroxiredoxin